MARARHVGVRELVDERDLRLAGEDGIDVHFLELDTAILDDAQRHGLEVADQRLGVRPAVRLDEADDDIEALSLEEVRILQHLIGLANARRGADVHAQPRPLVFFELREQGRGIWSARSLAVIGAGHCLTYIANCENAESENCPAILKSQN